MPEKTWPKLTSTQMAEIAPLRDGVPDLYNNMPTRMVPKQEAEARGWTFFSLGESCRWGHVAPRYVSNPRMCVDCHRIKHGRLAIGAKGNKEYSGNLKGYAQRAPQPTVSNPTPTIPRPLEPDAIEKKFLTEYARHRDFKLAAEACNRHEAEFLGRLSFDKIFREAVNQLEADNGLTRTLSLSEEFEWSDDKRMTLVRTYINTGDLLKAMKSVGVTNFHFEKEMQDNATFRTAMENAEESATRLLERHVISGSLDGDSRASLRVLAAKMPEYGDRMKVDLNVTQKLTDEQLNTRLAQGLARLEQAGITLLPAPEPVDAEYSEYGPDGEDEAFGDYRDEASEVQSQSNMDLV